MGGVDAELVGAAGVGEEGDAGDAGGVAEEVPVGGGALAVDGVVDLAGAIVDVGAERQVDDAAIGGRDAVEEGEVALVDVAVDEEALELGVDWGGLGGDQEAGGVEVEAMDEEGTFKVREARA